MCLQRDGGRDRRASPGYQSLIGATDIFSAKQCAGLEDKTAAEIDSALPHITMKLDGDAGGGQRDLTATTFYLSQHIIAGVPAPGGVVPVPIENLIDRGGAPWLRSNPREDTR